MSHESESPRFSVGEYVKDLGLFWGLIAIAIAVIFARGQRVTVIPYGF